MSDTCEARVTVRNEKGLHLHVASLIARAAGKFECEVTLSRGEIRANGKSVMSITLLAAPRGTELDLICEGSDAKEAAEHLIQAFEEQFGAP